VITDIAGRYGLIPTSNVAGVATIDCANATANTLRLNVTAAATLTLTQAMPGMRLCLLLVASGSGTPPFAVTFAANVRLTGAVSLATLGSGIA